MELFMILLGMVFLFFILLLAKQILHWEYCVLCVTISLSWITLLTLYWLRLYDNLLFIALLLGGTIVGIYYVVEKKVKEDVTLFRLPFLLTMICLGYFLVTFSMEGSVVGVLAAVWILCAILYNYRTNSYFTLSVQKMIACCKKW